MLITAFNLLLIILGFGLLIFVHELGHFLAARWAGIRTEAFAVGMGPVMLAWRKGIGFAPKSTYYKVIEKTGKAPHDLSDAELERHGIGETEYSLRWLPIGGFVKMLGQEDANPNYVSDDPRSYNRCSIGKRMIVVSAGVIMNLILAAILFVIVFMVGVRFDAPIVGQVSPALAAGTTMPENAEELGITRPGLKPGDRVVFAGNRRANTFADVQIASAMSRPDVPVRIVVERPGIDEPLRFSMHTERDPGSGLLSIGVAPAFSTQLAKADRRGELERMLQQAGLAPQGVKPEMVMLTANGAEVETFEQYQQIVRDSGGLPITTTWSALDRSGDLTGPRIEAIVEPQPELSLYVLPDVAPHAVQNYDFGLLGLSPLVRITSLAKDSPNQGILMPGDIVLRIGDHIAPRLSAFHQIVRTAGPGTIDMTVLRGGEEIDIAAQLKRRALLSHEGQLGIGVGLALDLPIFANPIERVSVPAIDDQPATTLPTAIAPHTLLPGSRIEKVNGTPVVNWADFRRVLAHSSASAPAIKLTIAHSVGGSPETIAIEVTQEEFEAMSALGWESQLHPFIFDPIHTVRTAGGNPGRALTMGLEETHKMVMLTYLTIDRLFRRTVGVEQLRGPVGIIHLGATIADRGLLYLLFLLAVISVNLAVINFLPLPIVDGGLFLFLIYEKIKGQPPSIAFQNAVTILGLMLIGSVFLVVTYHDILRLVS